MKLYYVTYVLEGEGEYVPSDIDPVVGEIGGYYKDKFCKQFMNADSKAQIRRALKKHEPSAREIKIELA
jgi:hypothetical protein